VQFIKHNYVRNYDVLTFALRVYRRE